MLCAGLGFEMLDMKTVFISYLFSNIIITIIIAMLWKQNRNRYRGLLFWLLDYIMQAAGIILLTLRGSFPFILTIVLANIFIVGGSFFAYIGICLFSEKKVNQIHNYIIMAAFAGLLFYFTYVKYDISMRTVFISAGIIIMTAQAAVIMFRSFKDSLKLSAVHVGVIFLIFAITAALRIVNLVIRPVSPDAGLYNLPGEQVLSIFIYQILTIWLTFALLMIVVKRLLVENEMHEAECMYSESIIKSSEQQLLLITNNLPAFVMYIDSVDFKYHFVNMVYADVFGMKPEQMIGRSVEECIGTESYQRALPWLKRAGSGEYVSYENIVPIRGEKRNFIVNYVPDFDESGSVRNIIAMAFDITEHKLAEEQMKKTLFEKETLLRELYHRTKNTMMVISSMIELQAKDYPGNLELQRVVSSTKDRIRAISLVHQMLYQSRNLSRISIKSYIEELASLVLQSFGESGDRISLDMQIEDRSFLLDTAIPFGSILNELMTNSLKYAFPGNKKGRISISLSGSESGKLVLNYSDNGAGVGRDFDFRNQSTLGLKLIYNIGEMQLMGRVVMKNDHGVKCTFEFQDNLYEQRV